ncbi:MAG: efflux RND transporter periplasmic adaptor subunit [Rhodoferax sp.]|uniref:efflux RND transporter periplasmic adaptor subunit n=1 Tax=Rhodoferax sp. TaxID=50421 RepID=UPI00326354F2
MPDHPPRSAPMKRYWPWLAGGIAAVALAVTGWVLLRAPRVDVLEIRQAPLVRTLQFSARVATLSRVDIGSTVTGRVAQVLVSEGAQVRKGQLLVQLESDELRAAVAQAAATEQQAVARIAGLRSSGRSSALAGVAQADSTLKAAQAELLRTRQLVAQGFVSASRLDDAQRAFDVARAQQTSAGAQAQANGDGGTDLVQAQAQLALARAATQAAQARLVQTAVSAPSDARVLVRQVEPGQIVQPGRALLSLALAGPTQLIAQVDERFLDQLKPGQQASVVADAFPGQRFGARVLSIAPAVDAQRGAIELKFALDQQPPPFLREDMTLSVELETGRREQALTLPLSALRSQTSETSATVLVARDGKAQQQVVRLGLRTLDAAEVLQGLSAGDLVVLDSKVEPGSRIRTQLVGWQAGKLAAMKSDKADAGSALTNAMGR